MTRTRRAALAALAAATLATAGCGSGFNAGTQMVRDPGAGAYATAGPVRVINALVVTPPEGGAGVLSMSVAVAQGVPAERIVKISSDRAGSVEGADGLVVQPGSVLRIGGSPQAPVVTFRDLQVRPGSVLRLTIQLDPSSPITLTVPVIGSDAAPEYANLTPRASESAIPAPVPSAPVSSPTPAPTDTSAQG